jgi:4,5-DOPA dioxygenase extradiol
VERKWRTINPNAHFAESMPFFRAGTSPALSAKEGAMTIIDQKGPAASRMPVLFVGHGTPLNALADNDFTRAWGCIGDLVRPSAILSISGHWYTRGLGVTAMKNPRTIYDFGYQNLRHLTYPAPGSPALAERIATLLAPRMVIRDQSWGLDHGTWSVLLKMYPDANIPVVQLSIDASVSMKEHFERGRALRSLRDEGVLIIATGNITHNLELSIRSGPEPAFPWAERFDGRVRDVLESRDWERLLSYKTLDEEADLSIPTEDHYLPLIYAIGAADKDEPLHFPIEGISRGTMSMRSVFFGG